jgi:hypothetical protein
MPRLRVPALFVLPILASAALSRAQENPPSELYSPDHQYCVTILQTALAGSDPYEGFFTIAVRHGKQDLSKFRTEGYLIDAFWSPDGRYVAVDNRRANSGDYLLVFRLTDGRAIKMPVDAKPGQPDDVYDNYAEEVVSRVTRLFILN